MSRVLRVDEVINSVDDHYKGELYSDSISDGSDGHKTSDDDWEWRNGQGRFRASVPLSQSRTHKVTNDSASKRSSAVSSPPIHQEHAPRDVRPSAEPRSGPFVSGTPLIPKITPNYVKSISLSSFCLSCRAFHILCKSCGKYHA